MTHNPLRGQLVDLRPLKADDYDALYAVASDPLIPAPWPPARRDAARREQIATAH